MVAYLATVVWYVLLNVTTVMVVVSAVFTLVTGLAMVFTALLSSDVYCKTDFGTQCQTLNNAKHLIGHEWEMLF